MTIYTYRIINIASGKTALVLNDNDKEAPIYVGSKDRCEILLEDIKSGKRDVIGNKTLSTHEVTV